MNSVDLDRTYEQAIETVALDTDVMAEAEALARRLRGMEAGRAWAGASSDELLAYATAWVIARMVYDLHLDHGSMWRLRGDHDAFLAEAARIARNKKRRAGVTALERKYGHDIAATIVFRHSGRRIR